MSSKLVWAFNSSSDCHVPTNVGCCKDAKHRKHTEVTESGPGEQVRREEYCCQHLSLSEEIN